MSKDTPPLLTDFMGFEGGVSLASENILNNINTGQIRRGGAPRFLKKSLRISLEIGVPPSPNLSGIYVTLNLQKNRRLRRAVNPPMTPNFKLDY